MTLILSRQTNYPRWWLQSLLQPGVQCLAQCRACWKIPLLSTAHTQATRPPRASILGPQLLHSCPSPIASAIVDPQWHRNTGAPTRPRAPALGVPKVLPILVTTQRSVRAALQVQWHPQQRQLLLRLLRLPRRPQERPQSTRRLPIPTVRMTQIVASTHVPVDRLLSVCRDKQAIRSLHNANVEPRWCRCISPDG
jgi:hypothetical protein